MKWNNKFATILLISILGILSSCGSDVEEAALDLNFTLTYEDAPLVAFEEIDYPLGFKVFFTKYSLFLSEITLTSTEGDYKLSDVEFIDLLTGVNDINSAQAGKTITYLNIPAREYNGLSFNIGVPSSVNNTAPASYDVDSPLSNNGEYWVGWSSYIFHKLEGKMDTDGDGETDASLALHLGSDMSFRSVELPFTINIDEEKETIDVDFDLAKILNIDGTVFDLIETPQIHTLEGLPRALPILDNTAKKVVAREK